MKSPNFDRRFILKGVGACVALPLLESLSAAESGSISKGFQEIRKFSSSRSGGEGHPLSKDGIPKRLGFLCMGYGVSKTGWFPSSFGENYELPYLVQPFEPVKDDITFLQNMHVGGRPKNPHGATQSFLMGEANTTTGGSVDMTAAALIGRDTRLDHIAYGRLGRADGHGTLPSYNLDGGKAGAYSSEVKLYEALFGDGNNSKIVLDRLRREQSSLDAVIEDAKRLARQVGVEDRDRIDEYFTSIRNIEKRLSKAQQHIENALAGAPFPKSQLEKKGKSLDNILDMMLVAMQSDSTRVFTYTLPTQVVIGYHPHRMSHKASGPLVEGKLTHHQVRDLAFSKSVARFLTKLKETKEGDGKSLLDHSLIAYGTTLRSGHTYGNPPFILAGQGGGGVNQGKNLNAKGYGTGDVWLSMLRHVGVEARSFGKASGKPIRQMGFS